MNSPLKSRRHFLQHSSRLLAAGVILATSACGSKKLAVCVSPEAENSGLRNSLGYSGQASDPDRPCRDCAFFSQSQDSAHCGQCELLQASVDADGTCNSWSARG